MRFMNCPNCLSSHADDRLERPPTIAVEPANRRKRSRLYNITKALFSPMHSFGNASNNTPLHIGTSGSRHQTKRHRADTLLCVNFKPKYCIERKHKVKKRDVVQQTRRLSMYGVKGKRYTTNTIYVF